MLECGAMEKKTPYKSTGDRAYETHCREQLNSVEQSILLTIKNKGGTLPGNKSLPQLARELHVTCGELRSSIRSLINKGMIRANTDMQYKLTATGERMV